jgi:RND family efflux transporter MFP subunit
MAQVGGIGELDCVIEPHMVVDLSSRVDGIVESIVVERGDLVDVDQVLVELDSGVEQVAVAHSRVRAYATSEVLAGNVSFAFANRRMDRVETLFKTAVVSPDQMDEVSTNANLAKLQLQRAEENQRLAKLELRQSVEILDRHTIRSPIRGVVVQRFLAPGESVKDVPILRIAQIDPLRVEVIVPVSEFGSIEAGQSAIVHPEAPMQGNYAAMVTIVDRVADAASGTFRVRLSLPNPDYALPSGLKCGVNFLQVNPRKNTQVAKAITPTGLVPRMTAETERAQCQTVGPIKDEPLAMSLLTTLKAYSADIQFRQARDKQTAGYLVLSPDQGSIQQAKAYAETVKAAGIDDIHTIHSGRYVGRVSLGYYGRKADAEQHQVTLAKVGFDSELMPKTKVRPTFWLDLETTNVNAIAAIPALDGINVETVSCDSTLAARD